MTARESQVVTTIQYKTPALDAEAIIEFAQILREQKVRLSAPVQVQYHEGQRGESQGVTLTAMVVHP